MASRVTSNSEHSDEWLNAQDVRQILGVNFYVGDLDAMIERISQGGLLVVPGAPALKDIAWNSSYREALIDSDVAITDSGLMVILWNLFERDSIRRVSGLQYLRELLRQSRFREPGSTLWVMAGPASARKNLQWLKKQEIEIPDECVYEAPIYGESIEDAALLARLRRLRPRHVVLTIGGGTQERLGYYLKHNLDYRPAIHCIGAAVAFLSGDQVRIPAWADRVYLGWFFRCASAPGRYVPRYWSALRLAPMLWRYRSRLPVSTEF
jgi:UDP-N-acetyl-D-mannosaminuronic acid transferase (WecB/TagA/CpsF family)